MEASSNAPLANTGKINETAEILSAKEKQALKEYFIRQNEQVKQAYRIQTDEGLTFLLLHSEKMKTFLSKLQLPWHLYLPFLHEGALLCYQRKVGKEERNQLITHSTELIKIVFELSQVGRLIHDMVAYYHNQTVTLKTLIAEDQTPLQETTFDQPATL